MKITAIEIKNYSAFKRDITHFPFCNLFSNTCDGYIRLQISDPQATKKRLPTFVSEG